jgi:DSF synthase
MPTVAPHSVEKSIPYRQISTRYDPQHGALWCILDPKPRACFSLEVLTEIRRFQRGVERLLDGTAPEREQIRYVILASKTPGVFNFGGDLFLFSRCVKEQDADALRAYAHACIDVLHPQTAAYDLPIITISLVQGDALGGGFEAALCSDILIAERSAQMGFPEVLFNLIPGMGAYNLLHRRISLPQTERMILSGKLYRAEELHDAGIVDILADDGCGQSALYEYIVRRTGKNPAHEAIRRVRRKLCPIRREQLLEVAEIWVETAMRIGPRELRLMERLARAQERLPLKDFEPVPAGEQRHLLHTGEPSRNGRITPL